MNRNNITYLIVCSKNEIIRKLFIKTKDDKGIISTFKYT